MEVNLPSAGQSERRRVQLGQASPSVGPRCPLPLSQRGPLPLPAARWSRKPSGPAGQRERAGSGYQREISRYSSNILDNNVHKVIISAAW